MPATSTRTSTSRTRARRKAGATVALFVAGAFLPQAQGAPFRLASTLSLTPRAGDAPAIETPRGMRLRLAQSLASGPAASMPPAPSAPTPPIAARRLTYEDVLLEVDLNQQHIDKSIIVLRRSDGMFLLRLDDLASMRLKIPSTAPHLHEETPYFPIDSLPGGRFAFDERRQRLAIMVGPEAFESTTEVVPGSGRYPGLVRSTYGGFLNYQLDAIHATGTDATSGNIEAGFFTPYGVLLNEVVSRHDDSGTRTARLDTTFVADFPASHSTLRVGDSILRPGSWGNAVRFGGIQFGTNFTTEPGLITFPTQAVRGQAVVPSLVDVYVNNALVATRGVDPGPFTLSNIPFTTGGGTVRLVVRDINNREQVLTVSQPFYASNAMLKPGLSDYSAEVGRIRDDFGLESWKYSDTFASGTFRHGFSERFTAEARAEGSADQQALGLSASVVQAALGQFDVTAAGSHSAAGSGWLAGLGYQHQMTIFSVGGQAQWASPEFRRIGQLPGEPPPRLQAAVSLGLQTGMMGAFSAAYVTQDFRTQPRVAIASLGYSLGLGRWGQLNVTALKSFGQDSGVSVAAGVTVPLGNNMSASGQLETTRSGDGGRTREFSASVQRNRAGDSPWSYRVSTRGSEVESVVNYRAERAEMQADVSRLTDGTWVSRGGIAGGIGYVGGYAFLSRRITGSFGVVQVADYPDVAVMFDNQFQGRTNSKGIFVIPELRAYDRNVITVREGDLPLDATVASLKLEASPYFRSGILIRFPVRHIRAGTIYLVLEDGTPLPSGAVAHLEGSTEEFPAALGGEIYLTGFSGKDRVVATWKGRSCVVEVVYPETKDPLPDLGRYVCKGVRP